MLFNISPRSSTSFCYTIPVLETLINTGAILNQLMGTRQHCLQGLELGVESRKCHDTP